MADRAAAITVAREVLSSKKKPGTFAAGSDTLDEFDVFDLLRVAEWLLSGRGPDDDVMATIEPFGKCCADGSHPSVAELERRQAEREAKGPVSVPAPATIDDLADKEDVEIVHPSVRDLGEDEPRPGVAE